MEAILKSQSKSQRVVYETTVLLHQSSSRCLENLNPKNLLFEKDNHRKLEGLSHCRDVLSIFSLEAICLHCDHSKDATR